MHAMTSFLALSLLLGALAAGEALPVGTWIDRVRAEAAAEEPRWTGADAAIRLGAAICTANHPGSVGFAKPVHAPPAFTDAINAFTAFWSGRGKGLLARWRAGEDLGADARWTPVLQRAWASLARKDHRGGTGRLWQPELTDADYAAAEADAKALEKEAKALLRTAYATRRLDEAGIALLRRYQRQLWTQCVCGVDFRPDRIGLGVHSSHQRRLGAAVPELRATPLAAALALPGYRDEPELELPLLLSLRADGVLEILHAIAGHRLNADGRSEPDPAWLATQPAAQAQRPLVAPGRPALLFMPDAVDCFVPLAYPFLGPLQAAYGDACDFRAVNVTIHDLHMAPRQFFAGPVHALVAHPWSLTERARTARNLAMAFPAVPTPWFLDDVASTVASSLAAYGGEAGTRLIDADGRLHDAVENAFYGTIWADELEKSLRALLANGGRRPAGGPAFAGLESKGDAIASAAAGRTRDWQRPPTLRLTGTVATVDAAAGTLVLSSKAAPGPLTVRFTAETRLQRGERLISAGDLAAKAQIAVEFPAAAWGGAEASIAWSKPWVPYTSVPCTITAGTAVAECRAGGGSYATRGWIFHEVTALTGPEVIPASRIEIQHLEPTAQLWLLGTVTSIDGHVVGVRQEAMPPGVGQGLWNGLAPPPEIARALAVLARWQQPDAAGRIRQVRLDASTRLSIDGVVADPGRIPLGARIACTVPAAQDDQAELRPDQVRVSTPLPRIAP